jgi:hypothetical protein
LKKLALLATISLLTFGKTYAQENPAMEKTEKGLRVKVNALFIPVGMLNAGVEYQLSKKITMQNDIFISPWKSFAGHEAQYYSTSVEGRYYFDEAFKHFFVGVNISAAKFVLQKWNYWNDNVYTNDKGETYVSSNLYQKGHSILFGLTAGYNFMLSERWNLELYATAGTSQDYYKGFDRTNGRRYDSATGYNKSGEVLPYRGGLMVTYKIK